MGGRDEGSPNLEGVCKTPSCSILVAQRSRGDSGETALAHYRGGGADLDIRFARLARRAPNGTGTQFRCWIAGQVASVPTSTVVGPPSPSSLSSPTEAGAWLAAAGWTLDAAVREWMEAPDSSWKVARQHHHLPRVPPASQAAPSDFRRKCTYIRGPVYSGEGPNVTRHPPLIPLNPSSTYIRRWDFFLFFPFRFFFRRGFFFFGSCDSGI